MDLTADNFLDYFNAESESELNDKKAIFKYKITPSDRVGEITEDSSNVIFVTVCFSVYSDANDGSPVIGKTESTIMLKRDEGYRYSGEAKLKLDEYLESVFWDGEITYVYGHLN